MRLLDDIIRPTLLVGSFPYKTAAETLSVSGPALAGVARRLTDGEPQGWTRFPENSWRKPMPSARRCVAAGSDRPIQQYRIKPGCSAADLKFGPAGYSTLVAESYRIFTDLRAQGRIAPGTRFQQSLPTPSASLPCSCARRTSKLCFHAIRRRYSRKWTT
jgi:hypothetical protein